MQWKAVIFDLDGTLVHTKPEYRYNTVNKTLAEFNKAAKEAHMDRFWFEVDRDRLIRELFEVEPVLFWEAFLKYHHHEAISDFIVAYDDVDVLVQLKKANLKLGIVTGSRRTIAQTEVDLLPTKVNSLVIANTIDGGRPKPDPWGIEKCMEELAVKKHEVLYVGNSDEDILTARAAGVRCVLIDRNEHFFANVQPDHTIASLKELDSILGKRVQLE